MPNSDSRKTKLQAEVSPADKMVQPDSHQKSHLSEDWVAVVIGAALIVSILLISQFNPGFNFKVPAYQWAGLEDLQNKVLSASNLLVIVMIGLVLFVLAAAGIRLLGISLSKFILGFWAIYIFGILSLILAGNKNMSAYGIEYVVFALIIGLLISNLTKMPGWLKEAARSEFYIKTGLVILGTSVLFTDIVKAGVPGILQAVLVVSVVWFFSLWISRRLKVDDEFGVILASAVSICGVSAAIAACGAIKGDKKKLSYVTTIVLVVAIPMLILQPWLIKIFGIPEIIGGAWLGGTLDTTASVTAAAQIVGPVALKSGVIVKFSQNVLIGIAALVLAIWWTLKKNKIDQTGERPGPKIIWERFPKFVLGFIAASLVFSFLISPATTKNLSGTLNALRTLWFALAFVSIGLEVRLADLVKLEGGRPALAFVSAQMFNIIWTLFCAYLLFGGYFLPVPNLK